MKKISYIQIFVIVLFTTNCIASDKFKGDKIEFLFKKLSLPKKKQNQNEILPITHGPKDPKSVDLNDENRDLIENFFEYETTSNQDNSFNWLEIFSKTDIQDDQNPEQESDR